MIGIYLIRNNINGKVYVGQSIDILERWADHKRITKNDLTIKYPLYLAMRKYGIENFTFSIIEECPQELLDEREVYWIQQYHSWVGDAQNNGYNITQGGSGNQQITIDEIKLIVSLWDSGKSVGEIANATNINNHSIIKYLKEYSNYTTEEGEYRGRINNGKSHRKNINIYDKYCQLIGTYNGYQEIMDNFNISLSNIGQVLNKAFYTIKGYYLIYEESDQKEELLFYLSNQREKQILLLDKENHIQKIFFNSKEIKEFLQRDKIGSVWVCCQGLGKTAYGYKWQYLYKYIEEHGLDYTWI